MITQAAKSVAIQVVAGVAVAALAYAVTLLILRKRRIVSSKGLIVSGQDAKPKQHLQVVDGYQDSESLAYTTFNTLDPLTEGDYLGLKRSYNRNGGAQFTYSFWMYMNDTTNPRIRGRDIILRGDARRYKYSFVKGNAHDQSTVNEDVVVKCPRIRFGRTFKDIVVEFNTLDNVMDSIFMGSNADPHDTTMRRNLMSVMQNKWAMLTLTFEDNMPINDFENGLVVRMFVNDVLYHTERKRTTLRQNTGNLHILPHGGIPGCKIGNVSYYNYAIGMDEVQRIFRKGHPKNPVKKYALSSYNKIDLYNL